MVLDNRTCYFPSGAEAPGNVPCRSDKNTWCCGLSDLCLDNGLCLNAGHQPYVLSRGACTSKDWTGCTEHCRDATPKLGSTISNIFFNGSVSLYCCGSAIAVGSSVVCPSTSDNDGEPFTVQTGRVIPGRALLQNVPKLGTASSTGNDTVAEPGSVSTTCKTCHDTAIGAGVGVPLGALALLFVIWAIIERRKAARLSRALATPAPVAPAPVPVQQQKGNSELSGNNTKKRNNMIELEGGRPELDGGESGRG